MKRNTQVARKQAGSFARSLGACFMTAVMVLAWTACQQEPKVTQADEARKTTSTPGDVKAVDLYNLVSVDGKKVPCTFAHDGHTMTVNSGRFNINADGTCSSTMVLAGRDAPIETRATYTLEGAKLTMKWQGAGMTLGSVEGDAFTMNNEGMVLTYHK